MESGGQGLELGAEYKVGGRGQRRDLVPFAVGVLNRVLPYQRHKFAVDAGVF